MCLCRTVVHGADVAGLRLGAARRRDPRIPLARPPFRRIADARGSMTALPTVSSRTRLGLEIVAALFAEADEVFANVLRNLFAFDAASIVQHTFFICFWGALTAGLLRWALLARPIATPRMDFMPASVTPFAVALGLLNALFLLFVVVQLRYFFGGAALVEQTGGLTYAEYARRGFFELVTASALVLPVLLATDFLARGGTPPQIRTIRQFSGLLLVLLAVIMASALERMRLYVSAFGLSATRLYATAFMVFLIGVFAWFA